MAEKGSREIGLKFLSSPGSVEEGLYFRVFPVLQEGGCGDGGVEDFGEFSADELIAEVEGVVGAWVRWGPGVDGAHEGCSFFFGEEVPRSELEVQVGVCRCDEVDAVIGKGPRCNVLVDDGDLVMKEVH